MAYVNVDPSSFMQILLYVLDRYYLLICYGSKRPWFKIRGSRIKFGEGGNCWLLTPERENQLAPNFGLFFFLFTFWISRTDSPHLPVSQASRELPQKG